MNRGSFQLKMVYLLLVAVLLIPLSLLTLPATTRSQGSEGSPGGTLARLRREHHLSQANIGEIDPTSETIKFISFGMRGIASNILWTRANRAKMRQDWTKLSTTLEQLKKVQPNHSSVWRYQAWNLSYNVSAEWDDYHDRYYWVMEGIRYLQEGSLYNENEFKLVSDTGWFIGQKIGRSDERIPFRRLFKEDDDFHGPRERDKRDNWLVGKEFYQKAVDMVDNRNLSLQRTPAALFYSDTIRAQTNYAEAMEEDGIFGERARQAWRTGEQEWENFGKRDLVYHLDSGPIQYRIDEKEEIVRFLEQKQKEIEALIPTAREKLFQEKYAKLTDLEKKDYETPADKRTQQQTINVYYINMKLTPTYDEIAALATPEDRVKAEEILKEIKNREDTIHIISKDMDILNYSFWRQRVKMEQTDAALQARESLHQANNAFLVDTDLVKAKEQFDKGFTSWAAVQKAYPDIQVRDVYYDLPDLYQQYRRVLAQLREEFDPEKFPLPELMDQNAPPQQSVPPSGNPPGQ